MTRIWNLYESNGKYRIGRQTRWFGIIWYTVLSMDHYVKGLELPLHKTGDWPFTFETINLDYAKRVLTELKKAEERVYKPDEWKLVR